MKRIGFVLLLSIAFAGFLPFAACDKHLVNTPFPPPTPTPPILVPITIASSLFNPAAVTVVAGSGIIWNNTDGWTHAINYTNGGTTCVSNNPVYLNGGMSATVMFLTPGTNYVHCGFHSACGFTPCDTSCEGAGMMTMRVVVQ